MLAGPGVLVGPARAHHAVRSLELVVRRLELVLGVLGLGSGTSWCTYVHAPSRPYRQPWYLQTNCRALPQVSLRGVPSHSSLLPRCLHTLWKARTPPSTSRDTMSEHPRPGSSLVK